MIRPYNGFNGSFPAILQLCGMRSGLIRSSIQLCVCYAALHVAVKAFPSQRMMYSLLPRRAEKTCPATR